MRIPGTSEILPLGDGADMLPMYVVYRPTTSDHPGLWVLRKWLVKGTKVFAAVSCRIFPSLDEARNALPEGLTNIGREPGDDPVIEEVWI